MIKVKSSIEGYFNLVVRDSKTLEVKRETGFFKNIITDYGLNRLGTSGVLNGCAVGSGNATPLASDVALQSQVARTTTVFANSTTNSSTAPYYSSYIRTYRFAEGTAAGNLSEVGINANNASPFQLWSRALILDGSGSPTTITVFPNEVLDVVYECRIYAMENDVTGGPITLLGVAYNWTMRAIRATADMAGILLNGTSAAGTASAYNGDLAAVTASAPSGATSGNSGTGTILAYANNSYKRQVTYTWSISQGNSSTGIKSVLLPSTSSTSSPYFQVGLDKIFPKTTTNTFSIVFEYSWARRSI